MSSEGIKVKKETNDAKDVNPAAIMPKKQQFFNWDQSKQGNGAAMISY